MAGQQLGDGSRDGVAGVLQVGEHADVWQFCVQCGREGSQQFAAGLMRDEGHGGVGCVVLVSLSDGLQHEFDAVDEDSFAVHAHDAAVLCLAAE